MNELKPEDVVKALECCSDCDCYNERLQEDCPFSNVPFCNNYLRKQSLALLREKDAEIERLTAQIEHCDACDRIGLTHTEHMYCIKQAKSEAIAEFAERLKSEVNGGQFASYKGLEIRNVIDQIAKEMKEGKR